MEYIDRNSWETKFPSTKVSCHLAWKTKVGTVPIGEFRIMEVMQNGFQDMAFLSDPVGSWKVHTIYNPNSWTLFRNLIFHWYIHTFSEDVTSKAFLQKDNKNPCVGTNHPPGRDVEDSIFCSKLPYLFEIWWKNHHHRNHRNGSNQKNIRIKSGIVTTNRPTAPFQVHQNHAKSPPWGCRKSPEVAGNWTWRWFYLKD